MKVRIRAINYARLAIVAAGVAAASLAMPAAASERGARLDRSFGQSGHIRPAGLTGAQIAMTPSGRLILASGGEDAFLVTEYRSDGSVNRRFGKQGTAEVSLFSLISRPPPGEGVNPSWGATATAVRVAPDGKILVAGTYYLGAGPNNGAVAILARLLPGGAPDRSFGGSRTHGNVPGQVIFDLRDSIDVIALKAGKILIGGTTGAGFVGRLTADGRPDPSFGEGRRPGSVRLPPPPEKTRYSVHAGVTGLSFGGRGTIYASGYANGDLMLARLRKDGRLDRRFRGHGLVRTNGSPTSGCLCSLGTGLARDGRGRLLLAGSLESQIASEHRQIVVARYKPNGALDRSFGDDGLIRTTVNSATYGRAVAVQHDGRIVVVGSSATAHFASNDGPGSFTIVRYLPDGTRDRSFFGNGVFKSRFGGIEGEALDVLVDRAGRIVASGSVTHGVRFKKIRRTPVAVRLLPGMGHRFSSSLLGRRSTWIPTAR